MSKLQSLLAVPPAGFVKDADIESPDENQLEQDFAGMAFVFLRDRAPALTPYLLGFEVVDREEDGSKAVGIFGFKVAEKYYYVPAFFVNNQVKGMDLLYIKDTNSFVPLRETWVNYILNRSTMELGGNAGSGNKLREDFESPNFNFMAEPPNAMKVAGYDARDKRDGTGPYKDSFQRMIAKKSMGKRKASGEKCPKEDDKNPSEKSATISDSISGAFDVWNVLQGAVVEGMHKDAEFQQAWAGAIASLKHETLDMQKTADGSPIVRYLEQFGGPRAVKALMRSIQDVKYANALLTFYPDIKSFNVTSFSKALAPKQAAAAKVTVTSEVSDDMQDNEKKRLVRDGFTIVDRRGEDEKAEMFEVDYPEKFSTPTEGGTYNMLLPTGSTAKAWIFDTETNSSGQVLLCVEPKNRFFFTAADAAVFVNGDRIEDAKSPYDSGMTLGEMEVGKRYALINDKGRASLPFRVESVIAEGGERVRVGVYMESDVDFGKNPVDRSFSTEFGYASATFLQLSNSPGMSLRRSGDTLIVPSNWKALSLVTKWEYEESNPEVSDARTAYAAFAPGSILDLDEALTKSGICKLALESPDKGGQYFIHLNDFTDGPHQFRGTFTRLVTKYGMAVDVAEKAMEQAVRNLKYRVMIKPAQLVGMGLNLPEMPGPSTEDISGLGMPMTEPYAGEEYGQFLGAGQLQDTLQPGFASGGQSASEQLGGDVASLTDQAAMSGQKNVFDHATIGGLAKLYDSSSALDSYLPELMKSLDRVGRILFIFYWRNEDFAERYGSEDLAEMEDLLRGVFKSFGDLVLKLKQKSVTAEDSKDVLSI